MRAYFAVIGLCISLPIWYYLMYKMLLASDATELMWFLFWIYIPVNFICGAALQILDKEFK